MSNLFLPGQTIRAFTEISLKNVTLVYRLSRSLKGHRNRYGSIGYLWLTANVP